MRDILKGLAVVVLAAAAVALGAEPSKKEPVVKEGEIVCVGCHLEKEFGAEPQCTLYAKHAQGFLASDGTLWTVLDNTRGHHLVTEKKLQGKPMRFHGYAFPKTQVLEARTYELKEGDAWVAYDYCRECGWEKGDNKGLDLCEDCQKEGHK